MNPIIQVRNLSKRYRIGTRERGYKNFREAIVDGVIAPFRNFAKLRRLTHFSDNGDSPADSIQRLNDSTIQQLPSNSSIQNSKFKIQNSSRSDDTIWALKDVSFDVMPGEVIGIIGRNGAGKSTLLKILSRITEPTSGEVKIYGRVSSLLEVGTGFHPELTGRENIFLNGAILGMRKTEIHNKFDEIVEFAEIEKFIDTPVKRYSSGMYVRLAFAVAAHLEPEILVVDEVLAVGDAQFQKKCLGKMQTVAKQGRTVLFVSHNLPSVISLCPRSILLVQGAKYIDGPSSEIVTRYIELGRDRVGERVWSSPHSAPGNEKVKMRAVRIVSDKNQTCEIDIQRDLTLEIEYWNFKPGAYLSTSIHLLDKMGAPVLATANMHSANLDTDHWFGKPHPVGLFRTSCVIPGNFLNEGTYSINVIVLEDIMNPQVYEKEVITFTVHDSGAMRKEYNAGWIGVVRPKLAWQTEYLDGQQHSSIGEAT